MKILIVEDDPLSQQLLSRYLQDQGGKSYSRGRRESARPVRGSTGQSSPLRPDLP